MLLVIHSRTIDFLDWKVSDKNTCVFGGFVTSGFRDIANCKIDGIGSFVARKLCKLHFIRRDNNRSHCSAFWKKRLENSKLIKEIKKMVDMIFTWSTGHHFPVHISVKIRFLWVLSEKIFCDVKTILGESWESFHRVFIASMGSRYRRIKVSSGKSLKWSFWVFHSPAFSGILSSFWWSPWILW